MENNKSMLQKAMEYVAQAEVNEEDDLQIHAFAGLILDVAKRKGGNPVFEADEYTFANNQCSESSKDFYDFEQKWKEWLEMFPVTNTDTEETMKNKTTYGTSIVIESKNKKYHLYLAYDAENLHIAPELHKRVIPASSYVMDSAITMYLNIDVDDNYVPKLALRINYLLNAIIEKKHATIIEDAEMTTMKIVQLIEELKEEENDENGK